MKLETETAKLAPNAPRTFLKGTWYYLYESFASLALRAASRLVAAMCATPCLSIATAIARFLFAFVCLTIIARLHEDP